MGISPRDGQTQLVSRYTTNNTCANWPAQACPLMTKLPSQQSKFTVRFKKQTKRDPTQTAVTLSTAAVTRRSTLSVDICVFFVSFLKGVGARQAAGLVPHVQVTSGAERQKTRQGEGNKTKQTSASAPCGELNETKTHRSRLPHVLICSLGEDLVDVVSRGRKGFCCHPLASESPVSVRGVQCPPLKFSAICCSCMRQNLISNSEARPPEELAFELPS